MHTQESVLENETHDIFWDIEMQTNHLILARRPNLVIANKKKTQKILVDFVILMDYRLKIKENEWRYSFLDLAREHKTLWNMKVTMMPIIIGTLEWSLKSWKGNWKNWKLKDELRQSKIQHCLDLPHSSEDLERLAVNIASLKYHLLTMAKKTNNKNNKW